MQELVHDRQYAGVPGRALAHMYLQMQLELEGARVGAVPKPDEPPLRPHGYTEHSWKFFDTLQPQHTIVCSRDVFLWRAFYS